MRPACKTISADPALFDANRWFSETYVFRNYFDCRATKCRILTNRLNYNLAHLTLGYTLEIMSKH